MIPNRRSAQQEAADFSDKIMRTNKDLKQDGGSNEFILLKGGAIHTKGATPAHFRHKNAQA